MADLQRFFTNASLSAQGGRTTHSQASVQANDRVGQKTASYPRAGLTSRTPMQDQEYAMRMELMKQGDGMTPFGQMVATDKDFQYLEGKRRLAEEAQFDSWIGQNFHKGDVAARAWLQDTVPDYYAAREQEIDDRAEFAKMVAKVKLRGPRTTEEMTLVYGLTQGKIKLEKGWNVIGYVDYDLPENADKTNERLRNRFTKGLLGPSRYPAEEDQKRRAEKVTNPFKNDAYKESIFGTDLDEFMNQFNSIKEDE